MDYIVHPLVDTSIIVRIASVALVWMFKLIQLLKSSDDVKIGKRISMFMQKCKIA